MQLAKAFTHVPATLSDSYPTYTRDSLFLAPILPMPSLRFYLDRKLTSRPERAVYLRYKDTRQGSTGSLSIYLHPPVLVLEKNWDKKSGRLKGTSLPVQKINTRLRELETQTSAQLEAVRKLHEAQLPLGAMATFPQVSAALRPDLLAAQARQRSVVAALPELSEPELLRLVSLPALIRRYITNRQQELSTGTQGEYEQVARSLERFAGSRAACWLLGALTADLLERWRQWLVDAQGENVSSRTANHRVGIVAAALRYFRRQGAPYWDVIQENWVLVLERHFKVAEQPPVPAPTAQEWLALQQAELPGTSLLTQFVRDLYCFAWCVSLRLSDLEKLQEVHVVYNEAGKQIELRSTSAKSLHFSRIPLSQPAVELLNRWQPGGPARTKLVSSQKRSRHKPGGGRPVWLLPIPCRTTLFRHLKTALKLSGVFDATLELVHAQGAKQHRRQVVRWEVLAMHSARHGFGHFMAAQNMSLEDTQLLMAHKTPQMTKRYFNRTVDQAVDRAHQAVHALDALTQLVAAHAQANEAV